MHARQTLPLDSEFVREFSINVNVGVVTSMTYWMQWTPDIQGEYYSQPRPWSARQQNISLRVRRLRAQSGTPIKQGVT